ncbi:hypothetical protein K8R66_02390 [bacterium]|nr:hypothetical protein [bacterium]
MFKLQICVVEMSCKSKIQIFVKEAGSHRKRIMSFNPNTLQLKILMTIFEIQSPQEMEGKIFQIPEEFSQTDLAFKYLMEKN